MVIRARHARQIREGIKAARAPWRLSEIWLLGTVIFHAHSNLTRRAFIREYQRKLASAGMRPLPEDFVELFVGRRNV